MNISEVCLRSLPAGNFRKCEKTIDQDGKERMAVVWAWRDMYSNTFRVSLFDVNTGEYLGDTL